MSNHVTKKELNGGQWCPPVKLTDARKIVFLRELARTGRKNHSALLAGVRYEQIRRRRADDKEFNQLCEDAEAIFADTLIEEATRRGRDGWDEPVYQKGHRVHEDCGNCHGAGRLMEIHTDAAGVQTLQPIGPICDSCKGTGKGEPAVVRRYCPQMMGTMLKGYDKRFTDKQDVNINVGGGVLAVPMDPISAQAWHDQYDKPAIDVTEESRALTPKLPEPKK